MPRHSLLVTDRKQKVAKCTFDFDEFDEFCTDLLGFRSVFSVSSVFAFLSLSLCLSDDDDDDTKRESCTCNSCNV